MVRNKRKRSSSGLMLLAALVLTATFTLLLKYMLEDKNIALLNPKGMVANEQLTLMLFSVALLMMIAIPTLAVLYFVAWKYRESNNTATYDARKSASTSLVAAMWVVPTILALVLAAVMWPATHKLVPQDVIAHEKDPMTIQVVSMNWKWLFIYPEQQIATVNFVQFPVDTPITFELTADQSPMSSFWIPNLGGQLYSMTTHVNRLNLIAETPGDYRGNSAEINGRGFSGMKFTARASSNTEFNQWVEEVKKAPDMLYMDDYNQLLEPSENHPVTLYSSYEKNLFAKIIQKYYQPAYEQEHSE